MEFSLLQHSKNCKTEINYAEVPNNDIVLTNLCTTIKTKADVQKKCAEAGTIVFNHICIYIMVILAIEYIHIQIQIQCTVDEKCL